MSWNYNGQPKFKGTVIFGYTFTKMLDQVRSQIFRGTVVSKNLIVRGANASNAFAEASASDIPLFVHVNDQYHEWYKLQFNEDIPANYVLSVYLKHYRVTPKAPEYGPHI